MYIHSYVLGKVYLLNNNCLICVYLVKFKNNSIVNTVVHVLCLVNQTNLSVNSHPIIVLNRGEKQRKEIIILK